MFLSEHQRIILLYPPWLFNSLPLFNGSSPFHSFVVRGPLDKIFGCASVSLPSSFVRQLTMHLPLLLPPPLYRMLACLPACLEQTSRHNRLPPGRLVRKTRRSSIIIIISSFPLPAPHSSSFAYNYVREIPRRKSKYNYNRCSLSLTMYTTYCAGLAVGRTQLNLVSRRMLNSNGNRGRFSC